MIGFPQYMVGKQWKDHTANPVLLNSLSSGGFKIPEFSGFLNNLGGQGLILGTAAGTEQRAVFL